MNLLKLNAMTDIDIVYNPTYSLFLDILAKLSNGCTDKFQKIDFEFIKSQVSLIEQIIKFKKTNPDKLKLLLLTEDCDLVSFFGSNDPVEYEVKLKELRHKIRTISAKNFSLKAKTVGRSYLNIIVC